MAEVDLLFGLPYDPALPARLVFGDDGGAVVPDAPFSVVGQLPKLRGRVPAAIARSVSVRGSLPRLSGTVSARYLTNTPRPVVNEITGVFQTADFVTSTTKNSWSQAQRLQDGAKVRYQAAEKLATSNRVCWSDAERAASLLTAVFEQAKKLPPPPSLAKYQDASRMRGSASGVRFQEAVRLGTTPVQGRYQDALRDRRNFTAAVFQQAAPYSTSTRQRYADGLNRWEWWAGRYQLAMKPPIGVSPIPQPPEPPFDPCYRPEIPANLLFGDLWMHSGLLIFTCGEHDPPGPQPGETVVVPVKEVYLTINNAVLIRVDSGQIIPVFDMSMQLDADSWTWGFSASVPGSVLPLVQRNSHGEPIVVQATINGVAFRFALDTPTRDRTFNSSRIRLQGRGLGAELDSPNSVVRTFSNDQPRNARQLLDDILTFNNISIGWDVGLFEPTDWEVPAGVFNHTGTYISALNAVVGAAGAYLQPHNTNRTLDVRLRYPKPYWQWDTITPDFEIPDAVATQEGITWEDKPIYDRVYVMGQERGVMGQYTRTGTGGQLLAPMVVDPLITHADAARQRGRAVISDTGRVATVTLRMPVLAETGVIKPGAFVRYMEGSQPHMGLTRSVQVSAGNLTDIYQTITLETHLEPV